MLALLHKALLKRCTTDKRLTAELLACVCPGIEMKQSTLATHYLPSHRLSELEQAIHELGPKAAEHSSVHRLLSSFEVIHHTTAIVHHATAMHCTSCETLMCMLCSCYCAGCCA